MLEAHHLIYVVGWSIHHPVRLIREPTKPVPNKGKLTLGELLKWKTHEGVRVVMLIWDDKTSHDKFYLKTDGIMHTHDEETRKFFRQSNVFRSIDSGSVRGFPKLVQEAEAKNLVCAKNLKIDRSIHTAYVKAIRSAQHFIYIENQYFIGSSYCWPSYKNAGADNLIPIELALKIASKIKARENFSVYVVVPMWPEGNPNTAPMQEILFWQGQTMGMMYKIIASTLEKEGLDEIYHPQDYLNFYCLGKREPESTSRPSSPLSTNDTSVVKASKRFRRFMIYVHSKGMMVDDEYVIIGSANINQRSLEGSRDTEIAMGSYQPHYTWACHNSHPHGEVYGYRMSLWAEHLGSIESCFSHPQSKECVRRVNEMAEQNWQDYVSPEINKEMKGHLMKYPIKVGRDGKVGPLAGFECFPDVGGKVLGSQTSLPDVLTT
ncbi:hypothetical protein LUZ60_013712 [Juncus effusus]|nr:hypothetical protein LUZ60_013712 [Juncus effusus]